MARFFELPLFRCLNHYRCLDFPGTCFSNAKLATHSHITDELELVTHIEGIGFELVVRAPRYLCKYDQYRFRIVQEGTGQCNIM